MEVKDFITLDEIEPTIMVPNPGDREYIVHPEISGFDKEQVITSSFFEKQIYAKYIGLTEDGNLVYMLDESKGFLGLIGMEGYNLGVGAISMICCKLLMQEGLISCRSINKLDLDVVDYKTEGPSRYWVDSKEVISDDYGDEWNYTVGYVYNGKVIYKELAGINSFGEIVKKPGATGKIKPIIVLQTIVVNADEEEKYIRIEP